jgi:hypothetical protein
MSNRYLGVISIERFLAVERYRQSHPAPSPAQPTSAIGPPPRRTPGPLTAPQAGRAGGSAVSG